MELAYNLFVSAITAVLFSFLVAKLVSLAVYGGDGSGGNVLPTGVDKGETQKGPNSGVEEGKLDSKLKVRGLKSKKKKSKKISSDTVRDSNFNAIEIQGRAVEFSGIQKQDDYFGVDDQMKNERAVVCPVEESDLDEQHRVLNSVVQNEHNMMSDEEEWEGIERNELEKDFARAMNYVKEDRLNNLATDVIMQFHDLQKVAMEGPCKISNPAKWNSWKKSGSMNPEEAMEKYITLLSDKVPAWMD